MRIKLSNEIGKWAYVNYAYFKGYAARLGKHYAIFVTQSVYNGRLEWNLRRMPNHKIILRRQVQLGTDLTVPPSVHVKRAMQEAIETTAKYLAQEYEAVSEASHGLELLKQNGLPEFQDATESR